MIKKGKVLPFLTSIWMEPYTQWLFSWCFVHRSTRFNNNHHST